MQLSLLCLGLCSLLYFSRTDGVAVASFNIQVFGVSKYNKKYVVDVLVKILDRYDLTLIQEIRDAGGTSIVNLLADLNAYSIHTYAMELGPRLGRSSSKEQYAFFYRSSEGIRVVHSYTYDDGSEIIGNDTFEREPIVTQFSIPGAAIGNLTIVGCHVKPSDVTNEMNNMTDVLLDVHTQLGTADVLMMGDFNADCSYLSGSARAALLLSAANYTWLVPDTADTTVATSSCAYDRFISSSSVVDNAIVNGSVAVFLYDLAYGLNSTVAVDVSDHYPIELTLEAASGGMPSAAVCTKQITFLPMLLLLMVFYWAMDKVVIYM